MVAIIIIILIIIALFYRSSLLDSEKALLEEKAKLKNFYTVIEGLKKFDGGFVLGTSSESSVYLQRKVTHYKYKAFIIESTVPNFKVTFILNGGKSNDILRKTLVYNMYESPQNILQNVQLSTALFEKDVLEKELDFWK